MSEEKNVFEDVDSVIEMVRKAGEDVPTETIERLYSIMKTRLEESRTDEWWRNIFINEWDIELKKNASRYRPIEDVMFDLVKLWLESNEVVRDAICRMYIGISSDNKEFYKIMDSYHYELYQVETFPDEKDLIYSSVNALKKALDEALKNKPQFSPPLWVLKPVYKYVAYGYNLAMRDKASEKWLLSIGIHTRGGFCQMFKDMVSCYNEGDSNMQSLVRGYFYRGVSEYFLGFDNVMDRIWYDYYKKPYDLCRR